MKTNLNVLVADILQRLPGLQNECLQNQETVLINLLKPVFDERDEALRHLNPTTAENLRQD